MIVARHLYDTNILVALVRDRDLGQFIATHHPVDPSEPPFLGLVSVGEIRSLANQFGWGDAKRQRMEGVLDDLTLLDLSTPGVVAAYVEVELACLAHAGGARVLSKNDLWIAATARATGATLLTTDRDFDLLHPGLLTRVYIDPSSKLPPTTA